MGADQEVLDREMQHKEKCERLEWRHASDTSHFWE